MAEKREIDWAAIRLAYETTRRSVSAIAREHGISHTAINRRAEKEEWAPRGSRSGQAETAETTKRPETRIETKVETAAETRAARMQGGGRGGKAGPWGRAVEAPAGRGEGGNAPGVEGTIEGITDGVLTPRQYRFAQEYIVDLNGAAAARRAGYAPDSANVTASQLLANPNVAAVVQRLMDERAARLQIQSDWVLQRLAWIAGADIRKALRWGKLGVSKDPETGEDVMLNGVELVPSDELDPATAYAIAEVKQTATGIAIKFESKTKTLELIGRHLKLFDGDTPGSSDSDFDRMTDEELAAYITEGVKHLGFSGGGSDSGEDR